MRDSIEVKTHRGIYWQDGVKLKVWSMYPVLQKYDGEKAYARKARQYKTAGLLLAGTGFVLGTIGVYNYFKGSPAKEFTSLDLVIDAAGLSLIVTGIIFEYKNRKLLYRSVEQYNAEIGDINKKQDK